MAQVDCQVVRRPGRMSIVWSAGAAAFEPIHLEGDVLFGFEQTARRAREVLAAAVFGNQLAAGELAQLGRDLHARFFAAGVGPEVAAWLRGLGDVESLEIGTNSPGRIPYAIFEDAQAPGAWGRRFALAAGRRVSPLRTFGQIAAPRVVVVLDPGIQLGESARAGLDIFMSQPNWRFVASRLQLEETLEQGVPDIIWMLSRIEGGAWVVADQRLTPKRLADVIGQADSGNLLPLVLSTGVGMAEAVGAWESFLCAATSELPGLVALETPAASGPACNVGLSFLQGFLDEKLPVARALRQLRQSAGPVGLALAAFTPPQVHVLADGDPGAAPPTRPLPTEPYHPLRPLEREERALLFGRDDDVQKCALLIDQPNSAGLLIHGRLGVGKASLARAGLLPFLEEENRGFFVLRDRTEPAPADKELDQPTLALRAGPDLAGSLVLGLVAFAARPFLYTTPTGRAVRVELPEIAQRFVSGPLTASASETASAVQVLYANPSMPVTASTPIAVASQVEPGAIWDRVQQHPAALAELIDRLTRDLPFELLIPVEQFEDIAALPAATKHAELTTEVLRGLAKSPARVQIVATLRTEYLGQLKAFLGDEESRAAWQEFYLDDLADDALKEALLAPTANEPLLYSSETPAVKYAFGFEPGAANKVLDHAKKSGYAALQTIHAVGKQLFDVCRRRGGAAVRGSDVDKIVKAGAFDGLIDKTLKDMPVPSATAKALRQVIANLHRNRSGAVTRDLAPIDSLKASWKAATPLDQALNAAAEEGPLLEIQNLLVDGKESLQVTVPQDSLAVFGDRQSHDAAKQSFARSKVIDALFVVVPLAILGMALTYFLTRRFMASASTDWSPQKIEFELTKARDRGSFSTRFAVYSGMLAQADAALKQGNTLRARQLLLSQQPRGSEEIRGFEWFHLWRKINGEEATLLGHKAQVRVLAMSPDGKLLASGDDGGNVFLWNLDDLKEPMAATLKGLRSPVQALAFAPDGSAVAGADGGTKVALWSDFKPGKTVIDIDPKTIVESEGKGVSSLAFVGDANSLAAGDREGKLALFDVTEKKAKWTSGDHTAAVKSIVAVKGGQGIASASDKELAVRGVDGKVEHKEALPAGFQVSGLAWLADEQLLVAGKAPKPEERPIRTFNVETKKLGPLDVAYDFGHEVIAVASIPAEKMRAFANDRHEIELLAGSKEVLPGTVRGHVTAIAAIAGGGSRLASVGYDNAIKVWDARKFRSLDVIESEPVAGLALDSSERILAAAGYDGKIQFLDPATGKKLGEIKADKATTCIAFSPQDNPLLLAAGAGNDVLLWEVSLDKDGGVKTKDVPALKKHTEPVTCLVFASDSSKLLASGSADKSVIVWDVAGAKPARILEHLDPIRTVAFEMPVVYTGDAKGVARSWRATSGDLLDRSVEIHFGPITGLQPLKGRSARMLSSGLDQATRYWGKDPEGQRFVSFQVYRSHHQPVTALAQGKGFFATGASDGTVKTWDPSLAEERFTYADHTRAVRALVVGKNNDLLISGGDDGRIVIRRGQPRPSLGPANEGDGAE